MNSKGLLVVGWVMFLWLLSSSAWAGGLIVYEVIADRPQPGVSATERSGLTTMRPRSTGIVIRSTSALGRVPIVQIVVAAGRISPPASSRPRADAGARAPVRTSTPRAASDACAATPSRSDSSSSRRGWSCSSVT